MLFHSYEFIFGFLPAVFLVFLVVHQLFGRDKALLWLVAASLFFYAQWSPILAGLLVASIIVNFGFAKILMANKEKKSVAKPMLLFGVAANLCFLGYFKYANFFIDNVNAVAGTNYPFMEILLPVGISFYTFIQIGFLVEVYNRQVNELSFGKYFLFASFFPYITAGPIVLQKEMMSQYGDTERKAFDAERTAVALSVFGIGLFKKLALADNIAPFADTIFNGVADGAVVSIGMAWIGALAYTLQLYFDFSGYSDMAIGIGLLFGLKLPLNFNSPLKAASIMDFWRRWHMTMTRFFTNYLYTPVAVSLMRRSMQNQYGHALRFVLAVAFPITLTFTLAGLWHGAGWTFVVFGLIHGVALAVNHAWREARMPQLPYVLGWLITMGVVITGLVFFRAADVPTALGILASMVGLTAAGIYPVEMIAALPVDVDTAMAQLWIVALAGIALFLPNAQQIMRNHWISSDPEPAADAEPAMPSWMKWRLTPLWAIAGAIVLAVAVGSLSGETAFLYYQF